MNFDEFKKDYYAEASDLIDQFEALIINLSPDDLNDDKLDEAFRIAHSIKGGAATFSFTKIESFSHLLEDFLKLIKEKLLPKDTENHNQILLALDALRKLILDEENESNEYEDDVQQVIVELQQKTGKKSIANTKNENEISSETIDTSLQEIYYIFVHPEENAFIKDNDPTKTIERLKDFGELKTTLLVEKLPDFENLLPQNCYLSWHIHLNTKGVDATKLDLLVDWFDLVTDMDISTTPLQRDSNKKSLDELSEETLDDLTKTVLTEFKKEQKVTEKIGADIKTLRINTQEIDKLINLLGELVITQSMLDEFEDTLIDKEKRFNYHKILNKFKANFREIKDCAMNMRMIPFSTVVSRFHRLVREVKRKLNKEANLIIKGEHTLLDKNLSEQIIDPIAHIIRNALDHGIETPNEREKKGKSRTGNIIISANRMSSNIVITITDDGKGIDTDKLIEKELQEDPNFNVNKIDEENLFDTIFKPGFSTAEEVTDISGRGVGMDVVKKNITDLKGKIDLVSEKDKGTTITLYLPLTLSIVEGQLVTIDGLPYVIPICFIREIVYIKEHNVHSVTGKVDTYLLRDEVIPVVFFSKLLNFKQSENLSIANKFMILFEDKGRNYGFIFDELLYQQQFVVKNLEEGLRKLDGISCATILGDGSVALVLDPIELIRLFNRKSKDGDISKPNNDAIKEIS